MESDSLASKHVTFYFANVFLIAPLTVLLWRGLWELGQREFLLPQSCANGNCSDHAALVGQVTFCLVGYIFRSLIEAYQRPLGDLIVNVHTSIALGVKYTFITFNIIVSIMLWSGSWALMDSAHIKIKDYCK